MRISGWGDYFFLADIDFERRNTFPWENQLNHSIVSGGNYPSLKCSFRILSQAENFNKASQSLCFLMSPGIWLWLTAETNTEPAMGNSAGKLNIPHLTAGISCSQEKQYKSTSPFDSDVCLVYKPFCLMRSKCKDQKFLIWTDWNNPES